ncbi:MAG: hypothetical protein ACOX5R_04825 [bacterium]|jgi:hypothetical protein
MNYNLELLKQYKNVIWPIVFWSWVILVSFWLDAVSVEEIIPNPQQQFSNLEFEGMRFEQLEQNELDIIVSAPYSELLEDTSQLMMEQPYITWRSPGKDVITSATAIVFSATAATGIVEIDLNESNLPSEFNNLKMTGGVHAWNETTTIDTETMIFNNEHKYLHVPGPYLLKTPKYVQDAKNAKDMAYDLVNNRMMSLDALLKSRQNQQQP